MTQKVLITGASGYIGNHLAQKLMNHPKFEIYGLDINFNDFPWFKEFYQVDLNDKEFSKVFHSINPDVVFHLAAQTDVRFSLKNPDLDKLNNFHASKQLIEQISNPNTFLVFTNSGGATFGETSLKGAQETDEFHPKSPYGINKTLSYRMFKQNAMLGKFRLCILNLSNVYGLEPRTKSAPQIFVENTLKDLPIKINGDGRIVRDWIFIRDVLDILTSIPEKGIVGEYNLSSGQGTSINELIALIENITNKTPVIIRQPGISGEIKTSVLNSNKLKKSLGFNEFMSLRSGIREIIRQYGEIQYD